MNLATFERAQVAAFAYREASWTGSIDAMRAICFVLRNRVRSGWGDGTWLSVINAHADVAALIGEAPELLASDRLLIMIVREIDDIYLGQDRSDDNVRRIVCTDEKDKPALFYAFNSKPICEWFKTNIVRQSQEHAHVGNIGPLMLYR